MDGVILHPALYVGGDQKDRQRKILVPIEGP